jgi:DNA-binding PadR family transcriptional regulator
MRKTVMETMSSSDSQFSSDVSNKGLNHTLHLYTSNVDKYIIQRAFLISNRNDEKIVYVTTNDHASLIRECNLTNVELRIIKPEEIRQLEKEEIGNLRLMIDAGSIVDQKDAEIEERESYLNDLSKRHRVNCLCTYDVTKLNFERIKRLAIHHNQLRLTTNDLTILSGDLFDGSMLSGESIEKMVKDNLESIILAIIFQNNTMCGTDIIGTIHLKFNVLLSPGTIYPLLHLLKQKGLLTVQKLGKEIVYAPIEDAKPKIKSIVNEHIQAGKLLNHYLQQEIKI